MYDMYKSGAFQGKTPKDAYFVKCDNETTSQTDIYNGVINIVVGFTSETCRICSSSNTRDEWAAGLMESQI